MNKYSVVIPCYKSSETIGKMVRLTSEEFDRLGIEDYEFVLVNDGSPDEGRTRKAVLQLAEMYPFVTAIDLAKNAGQHNAIMAGLNYACGDFIIGMDDDMQTHPSQLQYLLKELEKGYDVVYGYYPEKKHSLFRNFGSYVNFLTVRILIGKPKELKTSSYWIMRKFVRDHIVEYKHSRPYLQGLILRTTRNISSIPIKHFEREVGTSNYTFKALLKLWSNILGYSIVPLRVASFCGYFFAAVGVISAIVIVIEKFINPNMSMGWPSLMSAISFFFGLTFLFMGLIGEYVGRVYMGMNREPQYIIREMHRAANSEKNSAAAEGKQKSPTAGPEL